MTDWITDIPSLEAHYGTPGESALRKVADHLTPQYRAWIMASRFCILTTVGPEGTDGSPRGDDGPVVAELDAHTLLMPDWRGNNRLDSLRNIVRDGRVSLMFMVPGATNVVRVNGTARLTADDAPRARFERPESDAALPRTVLVIAIAEIYTQYTSALTRSRLWTAGNESAGLPSVDDILARPKSGFDASDTGSRRRAAKTTL